MKTTTFKQDIDGTKYEVTIPVTRVTSIIDRTDRLIGEKQYNKALTVLRPFLGTQITFDTPVKSDNFTSIFEQYRADGRNVVIRRLVEAGMSKASAYYRARKAGLQ